MDLDPRRFQRRAAGVEVSRLHDAGIGDDQGAATPDLAQQLAELLDGPLAKNDPRTRLVIKGLHGPFAKEADAR
jgi:hypothetical protein